MTQDSPILLTLKNWSVPLAGCMLVRNISLSCQRGEQVAVVGPNGSGKSTLLRSLAGLIAGEGEFLVVGESMRHQVRRAWARRIGFVPQILEVPAGLTVEDFLVLGRYAYHRWFYETSLAEQQHIAHIVTEFALADLLSRRLGVLSGGERQRVLIAGALVQQADILVLDEPTSALDPVGREMVWDVLGRLRRQGKIGIIVATHDLNAAALQSDRVVALRRGEVVFSGASEGFMTRAVLENVFGSCGELVPHPVSGQKMLVPPVCRGGE